MLKPHRNLVAIAVGVAALAGCRPSADSGESPSGARYTIAVIPKGTTHEFWRSVHAGAQQAADELGNVEIIWMGPVQEHDTDDQISVVQDFVSQHVDGIVLAPNDSQSLVPAVRAARDAGIPVVIFDSGLADESLIVSYVATDNYEAGAMAARRLGEVLGRRGEVILMRYKEGSESTEQREAGFLDTLAAEFPQINVLSSDQYAGTTEEAATTNSEQVLLTYRERVDGVFMVCEPNANGMLRALENVDLLGRVRFVAFDPSEPLIQAMRHGAVDGIVLQDPVRMGYEGVRTMVRHLEGEEVERRIDTGVYVATPDNMDEARMQELLHPAQFGRE